LNKFLLVFLLKEVVYTSTKNGKNGRYVNTFDFKKDGAVGMHHTLLASAEDCSSILAPTKDEQNMQPCSAITIE
jgi:hypothetical protein